jgi:hypothetical protein
MDFTSLTLYAEQQILAVDNDYFAAPQDEGAFMHDYLVRVTDLVLPNKEIVCRRVHPNLDEAPIGLAKPSEITPLLNPVNYLLEPHKFENEHPTPVERLVYNVADKPFAIFKTGKILDKKESIVYCVFYESNAAQETKTLLFSNLTGFKLQDKNEYDMPINNQIELLQYVASLHIEIKPWLAQNDAVGKYQIEDDAK